MMPEPLSVIVAAGVAVAAGAVLAGAVAFLNWRDAERAPDPYASPFGDVVKLPGGDASPVGCGAAVISPRAAAPHAMPEIPHG